MSTPSTYSPSDVSIKLYGMFDIDGFASDSMITINKATSTFATETGAQGDSARIHRPSTIYKVTLSLAQSSQWNQLLTAIHSLDDVTLVAKFPLLITDGSGDSLFLAGTSWIDSYPDVSYSNGMEVRTWSFTCTEMVYNLAGNEDVSDALTVITTAIAAASALSNTGIGAL